MLSPQAPSHQALPVCRSMVCLFALPSPLISYLGAEHVQRAAKQVAVLPSVVCLFADGWLIMQMIPLTFLIPLLSSERPSNPNKPQQFSAS